MRKAVYAATAAAAVILAACSNSPAHPAGWSADNVRVCQHYATQRADIKKITEPTLADAEKILVWIAADAAQATPGTPLARDLNAMGAAQTSTTAPDNAVYNASKRVLQDCTALGVTFQP